MARPGGGEQIIVSINVKLKWCQFIGLCTYASSCGRDTGEFELAYATFHGVETSLNPSRFY